ncbi:MAG: response regulator transcription factor [Candidatus Pacebacteria bacterium]|nr:response regulator transcription factor [Candidatus Paceibacterota bacterium]MBP9840246.1 response regulator transcription factor [Candidatus Paceibacterota bacterium]
MKMLVVEPDRSTSDSIQMFLSSEGFVADFTDLGEDGIDIAKRYEYDAIVLELLLRDMSGFDVIRSLRAGKCDTPIIVLTGTSSVENKVKALRLGADDYLTKPFHKDEMVARIHAIVRRANRMTHSSVAIGNMVVDLANRYVTVDGAFVRLAGLQYSVLELLVTRINRLVKKELVMDHLYGGRADEPDEKIVSVIVCKLKQKLEEAGFDTRAIVNVWGHGYRLEHSLVNGSAPMLTH